MTRRAGSSALGFYGRVFALTALLALVLLRAIDPWPVEGLRLRFFDLLQSTQPRIATAAPVIIVDIDEASLTELGQWPWSRDLLADLVATIGAAKPAAVAFDVLFIEPDRLSPDRLARALGDLDPALSAALGALPSNDARFAASFKGVPVVLGVAASSGDVKARAGGATADGPTAPLFERGGEARPHLRAFSGLTRNIPELERAAAGVGFVSLDLGLDGVLRRVPALARADSGYLPALALELIRIGQGAPVVGVDVGPFGLTGVEVGDVAAPTGAKGDIWLHYSGHRPERFVSAGDVLRGAVDPSAFAGKLVLVGATAAGLGDFVAAPLGYAMAGVEVHAELVEGLLAGDTLSRPPFLPAAEVGLVLLLGMIIIFLRPFRGAWPLVGVLVLPAILLGMASWALFRWGGMLLDPTYPAASAAALLTIAVSASFVVSERRRRLLAEQAASIERDARERIELLLESTGEAIYGIDLDGRCTFYNSASLALLGLAPGGDLFGQDMHALSHHSHADGAPFPGADCVIHNAYRDGKAAEAGDDVVWREDGRPVAVEQRSFPIRKDGEVVGGVVIAIDVTERKAAQEAIRERETRLRQMQGEIDRVAQVSVLAQVSSALAHELNQPLAAIMNYIPASQRILGHGAPDAQEKSADYMGKALQQARRAADIIKGLRDLTAKGEAERAPDDLNRVVEEAFDIAALEHAQSPVSLRLSLADGAPAVDVSRIQIEQVVVNLMRNSIEAIAETGGGKIDVSASRRDDGYVEVVVADDGPGLPGELADRLFQPFVTSKSTGMGVGLSICQSIVQAHGGRIWAENQPEGGAVFRFTLPLAGSAKSILPWAKTSAAG